MNITSFKWKISENFFQKEKPAINFLLFPLEMDENDFFVSSFMNKLTLKGSVQQKLRPRLLNIIWKLFSRRWSAENKIFTFLKGVSHEI